MALFSKLFDRDFAPYSLKGRWVKIHVNAGGAIDYYDNVKAFDNFTPNFSSSTNIATGPYARVADYFVLLDETGAHPGATISTEYRIQTGTGGGYIVRVPANTAGVAYSVFLYMVD